MEKPSFIFTSDKLELKNEGENFFVEGYISTSDLDLVNDIVTKDCLMDMADQMRQRVIKFDVEHESFRGKSNLEKEINKTTIPVAKVDDFLIDKKGLKVRAVLNKHSPRFNEVKGSIEDGFLDAFSIAYIPTKAAIQNKDGIKIRMLDRLNLLNVAFTGNPVNTESRMTNVFAKSLDFLEEQKAKAPKRPKPKVPESEYEDEEDEDKKKEEKHNHESESIKLQEVKMSEDIEKNEVTEGEDNSESQEATEQKDEQSEDKESKEESESESAAEVKALKEEIKSLKKDMTELKARIKAPIRKSPIEQEDKSKQFESKSLNPLDVIG
jgi:HK97 family phage prohead protease